MKTFNVTFLFFFFFTGVEELKYLFSVNLKLRELRDVI